MKKFTYLMIAALTTGAAFAQDAAPAPEAPTTEAVPAPAPAKAEKKAKKAAKKAKKAEKKAKKKAKKEASSASAM